MARPRLDRPQQELGPHPLRGTPYGDEVTRDPRPAAPVWGGRPSGEAFAHLLRRRADALGIDIDVGIQASSALGGIDDDRSVGPAYEFSAEVADWVDGVRILDVGDEDVSVEQALAYVEARLAGYGYRAALTGCVPWGGDCRAGGGGHRAAHVVRQ